MDRPFASSRPIGPFANKFTDIGLTADKEVIGVHGTPSPGVSKDDLIVVYVLEGTHIAFARKAEKNLKRHITERPEFEKYGVKFLKSGPSSAKQFEEQGVAVTIPGSELAVTESDVQRIEDIIVRVLSDDDLDVDVKERIYETPGTRR